jgi:hypothetical protein
MKTRIEMFSTVGRALTPGRDWRAAMASVLDIRPDSVRQLLSGRMTLHEGHFRSLLAAMAKQREELARVDLELLEWLDQQPPEDGDSQ